MRKLAIIIAAIVILAGCSKEDTLVGSKWSYEFDSSTYLLEFTSDTDVRTYKVDNNYNYKASLTEGKYHYNNGYITFGENFGVTRGALIILYYRYYFKTASISGDIMNIIASDETIIFPVEDGQVLEPEITYNGERTFTLMKLSQP